MTDTIDRDAAAQPVKTIMRDTLADVEQHDSVRDVAAELTADEIGAVLVGGPMGPIGVLSERDVVTLVAMGADLDNEQAQAVMTTDLVSADVHDSIADVGRQMIENRVRHVVVRKDDRIVGIVSMRDVLDALLAGV
ncbi:CBS domain-containing protein [Pseudonocardia thermophila]|jgi:Predicted signal-transduction protein containing cAMP-binding and CBS domains|uniref:CBS domain-containing protein n=1 Tax=Pseudonocardia thermophila TaxID=1848 RepID=A0A1M6V175_PSETH|nr:CBS domain-containing protein [Pseudonocardia thermophila]SHK75141.1 CBS domain-containing protein [Pseudonocardia thermophila]